MSCPTDHEEALAGKRPFTGATVGALAVTMTMPLALPPGPRHVLVALRRGLDPDPAKRWPDLDALLADSIGGHGACGRSSSSP